MDLLRLTNKLSQTQIAGQASNLRKSIRQMPPLVKTLLKLFLRRQRYSFQLLKYFVLFPGSSQMSEDISIDSYDRLIFGDDAIHSMIKIYQVKQIQNKIWAFINIKALKYLETCRLFTQKVQKIYSQKFQKPIKKDVFKTFKQYDIYIQNEIKNKRKNLVNKETNTQHKEKLTTNLTLYEMKIQGKNYFNSKIAINSNFSGQSRSKIDQNTRHIDQTKLTQSHKFNQDIPSVISIKSNKKSISQKQPPNNKQKQDNRNRQNNHVQQHSKSKTKIKFTYTSPTKQQIQKNTQRQKSQNKLTRNNKQVLKKINKSQYQNQYKYQIPKGFNDKKSGCQNCCGCMCCMRNCDYVKGKK